MINKGDISKHHLMQAKCQSEQPILLTSLRTATSGTIFMNQNTTLKDLPSHSMPFVFKPLSSDSITNIGTILEKHNTGLFSVSGQLTWLGPEAIIKDKEKRVRDARITDATGHMELSLWGKQIDHIRDEQFYTLTNCRLKHFYGKKLSTTEETIITTAEKQQIVSETPEKPRNIICCPDILNVAVNIYPVCNNKDCKKKVAVNPGSKILRCHGCNRSMLLKNCYVEVNASFQLEKDNAQKNVTAFAKVLSMFLNEDVYQYNDREDELTEKLLLLENVDFHLSQTGKLVTNMTQHQEMQASDKDNTLKE